MVYSVRIVNLDFYMNAPIPGLDVLYSEFRGTSVKQVPVLRVFGCTETGEKICVHIHGVFPYLYIPYDETEEVNSLIYQIASNIDKTVNISLNQASSTTQHVYKITLVSAIPMYGYHSRSHQFLKISLYNPLLIRKVSSLLMNESMLGKLYQPHETHLSYTLQFMIDYNLHGMSNMVLSQLKFRRDLNQPSSNIDETLLTPNSVRKISTCELEADAMAEHIINREEILSGNIAANPGIATLWADEMQRRRNKGETSQIDHPLELSRTNVQPTKTHYLFKQALKERLSVLHTEKQTEDSLNLSVYPAETPDMASIPNASQCDSGTLSSLELSLDETLNDTIQTNVEPTLNEDALKLLEILKTLNDSNPELNHEDSILSQVIKKDDDENELDLSMPLESISTPKKVIPTHDDDSDDGSDDLNKTIIPQLDGETGDCSEMNISQHIHNFKIKKGPGLWKQLQKDKITVKIMKSCKRTRKIFPSLDVEEPETKFFSLDGAWDSNSSSDEDTNSKRKKLKSKSASVDKYTPLPISVHTSPRGSPRVRNEDVKKQLNFSEERFHQSKFIEENILNKFSSYTRNNEKYYDVVDNHEEKRILEEANFSNKPVDVNCREGNVIIRLATQNLTINKEKDANVSFKNNGDDSSNSSENMFSDESDTLNKSFFGHLDFTKNVENQLTAAQKYDKEMNYVAKEGSSKVLTPIETTQATPNTPSDETSSIPPYQKIREDNLIFSNSGSLLSSGSDETDLITLKPSKRAPKRIDVINSLSNYNIPIVKSTEPFYSNVEDVAGGMEVGLSLLKIPSKTTQDLTDFESLTDGLNTHRKYILDSLHPNMQWKKSALDNISLSYCENRECILIPVGKPPTRQAVVKWLEEKTSKREDNMQERKTTERTKIYIPLSPGGKEEDLELSLTLTPCTPSNSQEKTNGTITPRSSSTSPLLVKRQEGTKQSSQEASSGNTTPRSSSTSPVLIKQAKRRGKQSLFKLSVNQSSIYKSSQLTGVTPNNTFGFNHSLENFKKGRAVVEHQYLTVMVMEVHVTTRGDFRPDPSYDPIRAVFYSILNDVPVTETKPNRFKGIIAVNPLPDGNKTPILNGCGVDCDIVYVNSEEELLNKILDPITYWDPDIIAGYEIEMLSWGYLIERAYTLGLNLKSLLGRTTNNLRNKEDESPNEVKIPGRIVLDVWRLMRHEIALQSYTFESITYHILHKRVPYYPFKDLTFWWDHRSNLYRHQVVRYYLFRVETVLDLFDKLDFLGRTSELARLFGILFFEVLSRGSQFRVESMMLRLAKPLNFIPVSPSVQQRAHMKAPEYIALVLEPESKLYNDPVIVLDFQSLYPSIIIAYNYCFTTCIGRVESLGKNLPFEFGATQLKVSKKKVEKLLKRDLLNFSPCGVAFVKKQVRDGILPRMLREILDTRLMVKNAMKENKDERVLQKVLHNRQLGLKLIANVTYGYTSANFSGRMPSVEVADSVVSKGRETLQRAIEMVDNTPEWGARVVYGDTDSLFVLVPGRSREHAFEIGKKIAEAVTLSNPDPMKLKLEKVYQPCILQTKKRYVGYMYESPDQKEPVYEAKGIETVRRDGCPAVSKMLEKCLKILFDTKDVSLVKKYVLRQFNKIHAGRASIQDLTFAREYRGASGYRPNACVPALELTRRWTAVDKRNEPRSGERVPYIIVNGPPGLPLIRLVRSPRDLLNDPSLRPNAVYYITRVIIPPINRCFNLIGADLHLWYNQMVRKQIQTLPNSVSPGKKSTISQYFSTMNCLTCNEQTQTGVCEKCRSRPEITTVIMVEKLRSWETASQDINLVCQSCTSTYEVKCASLDCPVLYRRIQASRDAQQTLYVRQLLDELF